MNKSVFVSLFLFAATACGGAPFGPGDTRTQCDVVCNRDGTACACMPDGGFPLPPEAGDDALDPTPPEAGKPDAGPVDDAGHMDAAPDAPAPACLTDLSNVDTGDFTVHFTLTTTNTTDTIALLNQRGDCVTASTFWEITLTPAGGIVASTNDGTASDLVTVEAGNSLNDGQPHRVDVFRRGGQLWYASDGVVHSMKAADDNTLGTMAPLSVGIEVCPGLMPAAGRATITNVCLTEP